MTSNASPGTRILGSVRSADGAGVVRIEDRYDTDIDDLWSAITNPVRLARWHGEIEGDLRPGGEFRLYLEADDIDSTGRIDECEPPRRLVASRRTWPAVSPKTSRHAGKNSYLRTRTWRPTSAEQ